MYTAVVGTYLLHRDFALEAVTVELNIRFSPLSTEYSTALGGLATKRRTGSTILGRLAIIPIQRLRPRKWCVITVFWESACSVSVIESEYYIFLERERRGGGESY